MPSASTVYLVDDDDAMRESLLALLQDAGYRVRAFASAEEFLTQGDLSGSCCVVSDVRMANMDGLALLRRLRADGITLPVVLITGHGDIPLAVAAMKAGASDFLEKPFEAEALIGAIETGLKTPFSSSIEGKDPDGARRRLGILTAREQEVLMLLVAGDSNKVAAAKLGVSPRTIEFHRAHILDKTGARGLPDLVRFWLAASSGRPSVTT